MDSRTLLGSFLLVAAVPLFGMQSAPDTKASFDPPILLVHGEASLGAGIKYPSPVLHDLDGDGEAELIVGDLTGRIRIASRDADGPDTAWTKLEPLKADGKEIEFHNW